MWLVKLCQLYRVRAWSRALICTSFDGKGLSLNVVSFPTSSGTAGFVLSTKIGFCKGRFSFKLSPPPMDSSTALPAD